MSNGSGGFKRMLVGLPQGLADQAAVETAVQLAELLRIELLATFIADSTLRALAEFPAVRELRTWGQQWHPLEPTRISQELERAASIARWRFAESVKNRTVKTSFDVVAGADAISSLIRPDDIVAIIEPAHPGERITRQFIGLVHAAFATAAGILVVPRQVVRMTGPIMVFVADPEDPTIRVALEIAAAFKEALIVLTRSAVLLPPELHTDAKRFGVHLEQAAFSGPAAGGSALRLSARTKERLRVVPRSELPEDALRLFSMLGGVPLLAIEPERVERAVKRTAKREQRGGR
ncbi:MAG TPA: hypothetical protein VK442_11880 [Xanthobacteraceae bacterium]|nr:hypothetical protein [Xanthobacteraceae bacterium]